MASSGQTRKISVASGNHPLILTSTEAENARQAPSSALQQQALKMARAMQTTLDVYSLIKRFFSELEKQITINSLHYYNLDTDHMLNLGVRGDHAITYNVSSEDIPLGEIKFTLANEPTEAECVILENALTGLVYPLRNALLYHTAVLNSNTDPLTKLGNRAGFDSALEREVNFASRHNANLCMLILDVDKFKQINDAYGHKVGDCLLIEVGKVLQSVCRNSDMLFRYGGDEFIVLLSHTHKNGAQKVAERIREAITNIKITYLESSPTLTASIGLACFRDTDDTTSIFERADKALYSAKSSGRNKICTSG